jgi:hypothetical protein
MQCVNKKTYAQQQFAEMAVWGLNLKLFCNYKVSINLSLGFLNPPTLQAETVTTNNAGKHSFDKSKHLDFLKFVRIFDKNTRTMTTKLTLTVEKTVIEKAKSYAKRTGRSLSELIEKYLESITNDEKNDNQLSPKLKKIVGAVKLPKDFDEEKELRTYLEKKHL